MFIFQIFNNYYISIEIEVKHPIIHVHMTQNDLVESKASMNEIKMTFICLKSYILHTLYLLGLKLTMITINTCHNK